MQDKFLAVWSGGVWMKKIKKECQMHGLALFRCKRRTSGKDKSWTTRYTEQCFKCGIKKQILHEAKRKKHIKI